MEWNRAHFGAWCIVSAPLVLGLELTAAKLTPIIDVITNQEAIAVNQNWAGHPGTLVSSFDPEATPLPNGFLKYVAVYPVFLPASIFRQEIPAFAFPRGLSQRSAATALLDKRGFGNL